LSNDRRVHGEAHAGSGHQLGESDHVRYRLDVHGMDGKN